MTRPELVETLVVEKSTVASGGVAVITKLVLYSSLKVEKPLKNNNFYLQRRIDDEWIPQLALVEMLTKDQS